jgi:ABC-type multidrug transport system fused ATPase/permease subunit
MPELRSTVEKNSAALNVSSIIPLALVLIISTVLMLIFHNRFWAPADEGNYAHVADRLLAGEVLNRDVQDVHAGYVNFVNAAAFSVFGVRMVSLRYPLAMLTVLQSGLMFLLLRPRGLIPAVLGALALASLTFVQFLNPTANWYCLFLTLATIGWLTWVPRGHPGRYLVTGVLLGTSFLFRQLSGVFLAIGVLVFLLLERAEPSREGRRDFARVMLLVFGIGLASYVLRNTDPVGWILLGVWPLPILFYAWRRTTMPNRELASMWLMLLLGALASALPLVVYHVANESVRDWLGDAFGAAASLPNLDFMRRPGYLMMAIMTWRGIQSGDVATRLNAIFWLVVLLLAAVLGVLLLRALGRASNGSSIHPLPVVASFYALVALHYQLSIYLFYTVGLTLAAVLWLTAQSRTLSRSLTQCAAAFLLAVGLYYQAGMPLNRHLQGVVAGERRFPGAILQSSVAGIYVDTADAALYQKLLQLTEQETQPGDTIFALPTNAELYFLSRRTNPFRFYNTALGLRSAADLKAALHVLTCTPPKLVFYNPHDKYNTPGSAQLAALIEARYERLAVVPPFQVFRRSIDRSLDIPDDGACISSKVADGRATR